MAAGHYERKTGESSSPPCWRKPLAQNIFFVGVFLITSKQKQSIQIVLLLEIWPLTKPTELWDGNMTWEGKECVYRG